MLRWLFSRINIWVVLISIMIAAFLVLLLWVLVMMLPLPQAQVATPQAALTVIAAPSPTPTQPKVVATPTPTTPPSFEGISIGSYVQISGTEGAGLRLRSGPGTGNPPRLLGMDAEVFRVKDGPKFADDFTWWFLEADYDATRSGWAASEYLSVVSDPVTATP